MKVLPNYTPLYSSTRTSPIHRRNRPTAANVFRIELFAVRLVACLAIGSFLLPTFSHGQNTPAANTSATEPLPLDHYLWREVKNQSGQSLGAVSDLLVQIPSGQIVFVVIETSEMYGRPKVVRPDALTVSGKAREPVTLNLSADDWFNAPRLDWSGLQVTQKTNEGEKIYGSYLPQWIEQKPVANANGKNAGRVSSAAGQPSDGFISLSKLQSHRVSVPGWDQDGFLNSFLIDWAAKRATHVMVSPEFPAIVRPDEMWYAIPVAMLNPPNDQNVLVVNSTKDVVARAQRIAGEKLRSDIAGIYQFPSALLRTDVHVAE